MAPAEERLDLAFTKLGIREPFIAAVMARIPRELSDYGGKVTTAATDGERLWFNPDFIDSITDAQLLGLVIHESMHIILMHTWRYEGRDPSLWNKATDAVINRYIITRDVRPRYELPPHGIMYDWVTDAMDAEQVYSKLKQNADANGNGSGRGDGDGDSGGFDGHGDIFEAPNEATCADIKATIVAAAEMAKTCGDSSSLIDKVLKSTGEASVDWRTELRAMMTSASPADYTYNRPSRRFIAQGLYLPSLHSESMGGILVGIDTSGSMTQRELNQIASELYQIAEDLRPEFIEVVYCDTRVAGTQRFEQGEEIELVAKGGGGTRFKPVFDHLVEVDNVVGMIYFTDMMGDIAECVEPHVPVIWARTGAYQHETPHFGVVANVRL